MVRGEKTSSLSDSMPAVGYLEKPCFSKTAHLQFLRS